MSKDKKYALSKAEGLIPELRFPEFIMNEEWKINPFSDYIKLYRGSSPRPIRDYLTQSEHGVNWIKIGDTSSVTDFVIRSVTERITPKGSEYSRKVKKGELILANSMSYGKTYQLALDGCIYDGWFVLREYEETFNKQFLLQVLNSDYMQEQYKKFAAGGIVQNISSEIVYSTLLPRTSIKEQQKIASCLSSLDELIAAHSEKLEALKDHKKGLMQNLFPQEGQKVPNYRFPEFEKDGEWELKPFSKFIKLYRGSSPRPIREYLTQSETGVNWIKIGDTSLVTDHVIRSVSEKITKKGAEKSRAVKKGELILANSMSYGSTYQLALDGCIYDGWFVLREYENSFDKQFLLQLLNSEYMQSQYKKFAAGGIVQNISSEIVYSTLLPKTSKEEQQKIASCLSALDALITAQSEKIEQLQLHKKGLMQGLFPKIENG